MTHHSNVAIWNEHLCNLFKRGNRPLKANEYRCPICGDIISAGELRAHAALDDERFRDGLMIARIKRDHPDWVETDGACPKCVEFYRNDTATDRPRLRKA